MLGSGSNNVKLHAFLPGNSWQGPEQEPKRQPKQKSKQSAHAAPPRESKSLLLFEFYDDIIYEVLLLTDACAKQVRSYTEPLEVYWGAGFFCNAAKESFSMLFVLVSA